MPTDLHAHILVIQTASIGDVILITPLLEALHQQHPHAAIDVLVRKGLETLFEGHPFLRKVISWDKKQAKYIKLFRIIKQIRNEDYDLVINAQRFFSTGLITVLSGAPTTIGFDKNPLSFLFSHKIAHRIVDRTGLPHEVDRNLLLAGKLKVQAERRPLLYPTASDELAVKQYKTQPYIIIAPTSLWFTKQYPEERWVSFLLKVPNSLQVYLIGSASDKELCLRIIENSGHPRTNELCGQLSLLQSAALMRDAQMNFVNDSAPLHLCSAVNAAATAIFCSTVTDFGFGPLSNNSTVVEIEKPLYCRPCGLHGHKQCPEKHFRCAYDIDQQKLLDRL